MEDLMEQVRSTHVLRTGRLDLDYQVDPDAAALFQIAERQNPKRGFLFVSTVLGRHIPIPPSRHRQVLRRLGAGCLPHLLHGPVLVMGFAETAIGLGAGVAEEISRHQQTIYLPTTRHLIPGRGWVSFSEDHSHASRHEVLRPDANLDGVRNLVLVDDEMTTGNTMANLVRALQGTRFTFARIVLVTLTDWSQGRAAALVRAASGVANVRSVSLLHGSWSWTTDPNAPSSTVPTLTGAAMPLWQPAGDQGAFGAPRLGLTEFSRPAPPDLPLPPRASVLVVGSGEHVWHPFQLAEALEAMGYQTAFCATTRSPIHLGEVIRQTMTFADHFGLGVPMYLHNVRRQDWDRVVLMTETGIDGIDDRLKAQLLPSMIIDGTGRVHASEP